MVPVLFSVSYAGFWGQHTLSLEEFIPHAAKLGYTHVELMAKRPHLSVLDWNDKKISDLKKLCDKYGFKATYSDINTGKKNPWTIYNKTKDQFAKVITNKWPYHYANS